MFDAFQLNAVITFKGAQIVPPLANRRAFELSFVSPFDLKPVDFSRVFRCDRLLWARCVYFLCQVGSQLLLQETLVSFPGKWQGL